MSCMRVIFLSCSRNSSGAEIILEWIIWRATLRADIAIFRQVLRPAEIQSCHRAFWESLSLSRRMLHEQHTQHQLCHFYPVCVVPSDLAESPQELLTPHSGNSEAVLSHRCLSTQRQFSLTPQMKSSMLASAGNIVVLRKNTGFPELNCSELL